MSTFYFWQNMVAMHQVHCLKALAERHEVHWLVDREMNEDRRSQGWERPNTGKIRVRTVKPEEIGRILDEAPGDALHVFAPRGCATGPTLRKELHRRKLRYALMAETPDGHGWKLALKGLLYRILALKCRRAEFTLAMGSQGADWYRRHGFSNVFPFGYTITDSAGEPEGPPRGPYRFIAVARLIPQKRHDLLFKALSAIKDDWTLECLGRGPMEAELKALAQQLGIADRITWTNSLPNGEARARIAQADTLILCSDWEGWGAVINEAIAEGTRVITSDAPGAACLLQLGDIGDQFPSGRVAELATLLKKHLLRGRVSVEERTMRRSLHQKVNGPAMAAYIEALAEGSTPPKTPFARQ